MKIRLEVKEDDKVTTYKADLSKMEETAKKVVDKVSSFFEETFKGVFEKETFTKEK